MSNASCLILMAAGAWRPEGQPGAAPEGTGTGERAAPQGGVGPDAGQADPEGGPLGKILSRLILSLPKGAPLARRIAEVLAQGPNLYPALRARLVRLIEAVAEHLLTRAATNLAVLGRWRRPPRALWSGTGGYYPARALGIAGNRGAAPGRDSDPLRPRWRRRHDRYDRAAGPGRRSAPIDRWSMSTLASPVSCLA